MKLSKDFQPYSTLLSANNLFLSAVSVAYEVTDAFFAYQGGIISDNTCAGYANHAVAAVGLVLVKCQLYSATGRLVSNVVLISSYH